MQCRKRVELEVNGSKYQDHIDKVHNNSFEEYIFEQYGSRFDRLDYAMMLKCSVYR